MRCLRGNTRNTRLFFADTGSSPRAMSADRRRCCNIATTSMLPHRRFDDADSDRNLLASSVRSTSFRIEPIINLLYKHVAPSGVKAKTLFSFIKLVEVEVKRWQNCNA